MVAATGGKLGLERRPAARCRLALPVLPAARLAAVLTGRLRGQLRFGQMRGELREEAGQHVGRGRRQDD